MLLYTQDMATVSYFGPKQLLEHFDKLDVPKEAKILDFCAGTGEQSSTVTNTHTHDLLAGYKITLYITSIIVG